MNITLKQLTELGACKDGIDWFKNQRERDAKKILCKLLKEERFDYARWYVCKRFTHSQAVLFSIFCAEQCISIFENKYPEDSRPRLAIEAAKKWLFDPTEKNKMDAADAAHTAAYAAADGAAHAAAYAAADAADAAHAADAAYDAAEAASNVASQRVIIEKAIEILGL
jgi:hypothetical protein